MKIKLQYPYLLILLFLSLTFASYGPARYIVEKTWTFEDSDGNLGDIGFTGYFLIRSPYQNVTITEYTDGMVFTETPDGVINVSYNDYRDEGRVDVIVKAIVDVYYEPHIFKDSSFQYKQLSYTNFTKPTLEMSEKALLLSDSTSMLSTTRALTAFTYSHIVYNASYLGKLLSAEQAYAEKQGVCAEYAHMFASLSRSVGLDTHYVYGYIVDNETQAHAWDVVELPGFGLLPTDPTFNEIGSLSNSHIAAIYGADNNDAFEYYTASKGVEFNSTVNISTVWVKNSTMQPISAKCSFNQTTQMLTIDMKNSANEYKFFSYKYYVPTITNETIRGLMLLKPFEQTTIDYYINDTFKPGYNYYFYPFFSADDQILCKNFIITIDLSDDAHNSNTVVIDYNITYNDSGNWSDDGWTDNGFTDDTLPPVASPFCCFPVFVIFFVFFFVIKNKTP